MPGLAHTKIKFFARKKTKQIQTKKLTQNSA